jgi:hypothetical protein
MHHGVGAGFGSGSTIKRNIKSQKIKNEMPTFWEILLLLTLERGRFFTNFFLLKNRAKYCLDPKPEPKFFGTGTAANHYDATHNTGCEVIYRYGIG